MFYFGAVIGSVIGFLASVAFPGVVAKLRAGYFAKLHQYESGAKAEAEKIARW